MWFSSPSQCGSPWSLKDPTQQWNLVGIHVLPTLWILHQQCTNDEYPHSETLLSGVVLCLLQVQFCDESRRIDATAQVAHAQIWQEEQGYPHQVQVVEQLWS